MVISSIVFKLISEGYLCFEDTLLKFLPDDLINGIHIFNDKDYSNDITILQMLSNTSGLPCYLSDKPKNGVSGIKKLESGIDRPWPTKEVIKTVKEMKPYFPPGTPHKAKYVDTNHQLFSELNMVNTGIFFWRKGALNCFPALIFCFISH